MANHRICRCRFCLIIPNHSVEGNFLVLGRVISRDGVAHCHGGMIDRRCAKIHRVCRSSLSAETNAAIAAADWALRFQVFLTEIFAQTFDIKKISPPTTFPLRNPFGESPTDGQVATEIMLAATSYWLAGDNKITPSMPKIQKLILHCSRFDSEISLNVFRSDCAEIKIYHALPQTSVQPTALFKPLLLTGCCSLFSCVLKLQTNAQERCSGILISYLRDLQSLIAFSFIDDGTNLGDVNTKHAGSLSLLSDFFRAGKFILSFIGRQQSRKNKQPTT